MGSFLVTLQVALESLVDFGVLIIVLLIGRAVYRLTMNVNIENELSKKDNVAMGVAAASFLVGLAIAASGGLYCVGDASTKAGMIGVVGCVSIVLMRLSLLINDRFIQSNFNNLREIVEDRNLGVAFVEAGSCLSTGLIINGVMASRVDTLTDKILAVMVYWVLGQVLLVAGAQLFYFFSTYDVQYELEHDNNVAAGLSFGAFLTAIGLIVKTSLSGAGTDWVDESVTTLVFAGVGFILLLASRIILDRILLPKAKMGDEIAVDQNVGAASLSAAGFIAVGLLFAASITPATEAALSPRDASPGPATVLTDSAVVVPATPASEVVPIAKPADVEPAK